MAEKRMFIHLPNVSMQRILEDPVRYISSPSYVYFIKVRGYVKIGYSCGPQSRVNDINTNCPYPPKLLFTIGYESKHKAKKVEKGFHKQFEQLKHKGEWFKYSGELKEYIKWRITEYGTT